MARRFIDIKIVSDYIKHNTDIYRVITEDIGRKADKEDPNGNNFVFCPFHEEKNKPSFNINAKMQSYRCFGGCQEGGDVIKWIQQWHGVGYAEALELLATRFGLDLTQYVRPATPEEMVRERYQMIFNAAAEWCHTQLMGHNSMLAYYMTETGFTEEQIAEYKVGYCPSSDTMIGFLSQKIKNITHDEIRKLELDDKTRFNDSLVYPVHDLGGNTCRIYVKPLHPPPDATYKYLGTSNSHPLFKRELIYGLHQIRKNLRKNRFHVTLVEGFKACIAAGGIAVMGTSVTDEQLDVLRQAGIQAVTTCFDGDQAGYLASMKVIEDLHRFKGMMLRIARMPMDTQCDTLIKISGYEALDAVLKNAQVPIQFVVESRCDTSGQLSIESKYQLLSDVAPILGKLSDVEIDISSNYLSGILGTSEESIRNYINDIKANGSRLTNVRAEESLIHGVLTDSAKWVQVKTGLFDATYFSNSEHQSIFKALDAAYKAHQADMTARVVSDQIANLFPRDAERLQKKVAALFSLSPEYEFTPACQIVQDLWQRRTAIKQSQDLQIQMMDLTKTPGQALHSFRKNVVSVVDVRRAQAITPAAVADKTKILIDERMASGKKILGYNFGSRLPILNVVLSGIQKAHQIIIAANQGVGKSLLAQNIIIPIAIEERIPTLWINQEMVDTDINLRMISVMSGIHNSRLQMGEFATTDEYDLFKETEKKFATGNLYIRQPLVGTSEEIYAIIEEEKFKHGIEVVVWDYLQLVSASRDQNGMSRDQVIGEASNMMTNKVAHAMNVASVCISQLNRSNFKKGEIREAEAVGGAYKIAQDADDFITVAEKDIKQIQEDGVQRGNRIIFVDKRRGGTSNVSIHANLDDRDQTTLRFKECATPEELLGYAQQFGSF